jgi:FG-GAP repeat.
VLRQSESSKMPPPVLAARDALLIDVTERAAIGFVHHENLFADFDREPLIPKLLSTEGPFMAVGDVNGDGLDDIFIGGAKEQAGQLLIQRKDGSFARSNPGLFEQDSLSEDMGAVFFDANGDGRPDLYVVSGGNEYSEGASPLQDRLYLNQGAGRFTKATGALPSETESGSRVAAADYDGDGAVDLFVGGRVVPWRYGMDPKSILLHNDGRGHFTDVTAKMAPELERVGMVTDALWRDIDGDGRVDLIVVGEWMPITVFRNMGGGKLKRIAVRGLEKSNGWWNRIVATDVDGDGRMDFVVGNLGLNGRLHASDSTPAEMYVKDYGHTGSVQQILTLYNGKVSYPLAMRDALLTALPYLKPRLKGYKEYASQRIADIFTPEELSDATHKFVYTFASTLLRNNGDGSFTMSALPSEAQLAPMYGIQAADIDGDGHPELLMAGNVDGFQPEIGRMSSSAGVVLKWDGKRGFTPMDASSSGFRVPGQARDIQRVRTATGDVYVVARNNDAPLVFRVNRPLRVARSSGRTDH